MNQPTQTEIKDFLNTRIMPSFARHGLNLNVLISENRVRICAADLTSDVRSLVDWRLVIPWPTNDGHIQPQLEIFLTNLGLREYLDWRINQENLIDGER